MANTVCDEMAMQKRVEHGKVKSPNFGTSGSGEKGISADCTWKLHPPNEEVNYFLKFEIKNMKLHYDGQNGIRVCPGSYTLSVQDEDVNCTMLVNNIRGSSYCMTFYHSTSCKSAADAECMKPAKSIAFPLTVTYVSDGRDNFTGAIEGFNAAYEFIKCQQQEFTTTTKESPSTLTTTTSTISTRTTTRSSSTSHRPTVPRYTTTSTVSAAISRRSRATATPSATSKSVSGKQDPRTWKPDQTLLSTIELSSNSDGIGKESQRPPLTTTIAIVGGAILLTVLIFTIVCVIKRKQRPRTKTYSEEKKGNSEVSDVTKGNPVDASQTPDNETVELAGQSGITVNSELDAVGYASVDELEGKGAEGSYSARPLESGTVNSNHSESDMYSSVDITGDKKETFRYNKSMVDNVLYGTH